MRVDDVFMVLVEGSPIIYLIMKGVAIGLIPFPLTFTREFLDTLVTGVSQAKTAEFQFIFTYTVTEQVSNCKVAITHELCVFWMYPNVHCLTLCWCGSGWVRLLGSVVAMVIC